MAGSSPENRYAAIDASDAFFQKAKKELTLVKYNQLKQETWSGRLLCVAVATLQTLE